MGNLPMTGQDGRLNKKIFRPIASPKINLYARSRTDDAII